MSTINQTLFLSDLHLCDQHPHVIQVLADIFQQQADQTDAVYILGDLFDVWLGDDLQNQVAQQFATLTEQLASQNIPCYLIHGNRDFLLGKGYAKQASLTLLPEHQVINLYGKETLLLHGDTLCTLDKHYQRLRHLFRNLQVQQLFLCLPQSWRLKIAAYLRAQSQRQNAYKKTALLDVCEHRVFDFFHRYQVKQMIHGHTHQPFIHQYPTLEQTRIVLGDWSRTASVLIYQSNHQFTLQSLPLHHCTIPNKSM